MLSTARQSNRSSDSPFQLVTPAPAEGDGLPTLSDFLEPIRRRWWVILLIIALTAASAATWTVLQPKEYEAKATLIIGSEAPHFLGTKEEDVRVQTGPRGRYEYAQYLETQLHVIRSRPVRERVVERLGLADDDAYLGASTGTDEGAESRAERWERAVELVGSRTRVVPVEGSQMVGVVSWDFTPDHAALVANTIISEYIAYTKEQQQVSMQGALTWLREQSTTLEQEVERTEQALFAYRSEHTLLSTDAENQRNTATQRVEGLGGQLTQAEVRRITLESQWVETDALFRQGNLSASTLIGADATTARLKDQVMVLEQHLAELRPSLGPNHHKVLATEAELAYSSAAFKTESERLLQGLSASLAEARASELMLRQRLDEQTRSAVEVGKLETGYRALQRSMENARRLHELVLERLKTMELAALLDTTNITKHEPALPPADEVRPRLSLNVVLSLVLGLMLGLGAAFGLEQLNQTVRDERELEVYTGVRVIGEVPAVDEQRGGGKPREGDERKGSADRYVSRYPRSQIAEAFRGLRTNLLFMRPNANFKALLVTSAGIGEGKTSVSTNLAIALAATGKRVCVIDTDLRRPRVHKVFDLDNEQGLTLVMIGELLLEQAIVNVGENLDVLRCGPVPPNPSEQLASPAFTAIVNELRRSYDMLIFDSPPAALLSDASMLSQRTDGVLLVVRAEATQRSLLKRAMRNLSAVHAEMLGAVVNGKRKERRGAYGYGYGKYGYGYGYGYGQDEEPGEGLEDAAPVQSGSATPQA